MSKCGPRWRTYSPSAAAITRSCFHTELTGASQIPEAGHRAHPTFALPQFLLPVQKCFLKPLCLHHSSQSWFPLQGSFTDIILTTSHKSRANPERNNTSRWWQSWNWKPDSGSVTALGCFHVLFTENKACCPSGRPMLARKHRHRRMKSGGGGRGVSG